MRLYGKNPVIERLKANPKSIRKILVEQGHPDAGYVRKKAAQWNIGFCQIPATKMLKLTRNIHSQGILADVEDFQYTPYDDLLEKAARDRMSLLFLDGLKDPQNLGSIMRSLACLGHFGIVLPRKDSVDITDTVCRVASGADNHVPVARTSNLVAAISMAKKKGFWIVGAVVGDGESVFDTSLHFPLGLVIGSEQKGIREIVLNQLDLKITIPMRQPRLSLNAAQATTILCYEITRQKEKK